MARYFGLGLLGYAAAFDRGRNPALITAGVGLVFLKNVIGNGGGE